jgi:hypothetical protein
MPSSQVTTAAMFLPRSSPIDFRYTIQTHS